MLDAWMEEFHFYLTYENPALAESAAADTESPVDAVKAGVCANINLFMELNEEEFAKYLATFAQDVWTQLTRVTLNPGQVRLMLLPLWQQEEWSCVQERHTSGWDVQCT